jgi:hypothetical protein
LNETGAVIKKRAVEFNPTTAVPITPRRWTS